MHRILVGIAFMLTEAEVILIDYNYTLVDKNSSNKNFFAVEPHFSTKEPSGHLDKLRQSSPTVLTGGSLFARIPDRNSQTEIYLHVNTHVTRLSCM